MQGRSRLVAGAPAATAVPAHIAGLAGSGVNGYFTDQYGNPKILRLEQCWLLPAHAGEWGGTYQSDYTAYFSARSGQGYTAWYGIAWPWPTESTGGQRYDGTYPFSVNGTPGPISSGTLTLNNAFWTWIDAFFATALSYGITCFLNLGTSYDFGGTGVWAGVTGTQEQAFGHALATRYPQASYPNVFWFFGDDDTTGANDTDFANMLTGLRAGGDARALVSMEQDPETNSHIEFDNGDVYVPGGFGITNATYNWAYTYYPGYAGTEDSYAETGTTLIPVVWGDGPYYGDTDNSTPDYTIRRFAWWALASGARGFNNTSGPTGDTTAIPGWSSSSAAALTSDPNGPFCTSVAGTITSYFTGLPGWYKLIPDTGNVFITSGRGTRVTNGPPTTDGTVDYGDTDDYVAGSITPDGTLAVIYCGQHFSVTIDQSKMAAGYTAAWADPVTCAQTSTTPGSTYSSSGLGDNSAVNPDWVLVLQGA